MPDEDHEVEREISEIVDQPKTNVKDNLRQYDIVLLKLKKDIDFTKHPHIRPVCLPMDTKEDYVGRTATLTGWGKTNHYQYPSHLQYITGVVKSNLECSKMKMGCKGTPKPQCDVSGIPDNMLCVTYPKGKPCNGDAGGPLVTKSEGNTFEQIGVATFQRRGCNYSGYGGYARVTTVMAWIKDSVGTGHTDCPRKYET